MDMTMLILLATMAVLLVLYMLRRKSRLREED